MDINNENNEELQKDLEEQYAMLENEVQEDKKKKRFALMLVAFLALFLVMFGTTFSYFKIYNGAGEKEEEYILKDLYVDGYKDAFDYFPNVHNYVVRVPAGTTNVDIKYSFSCQKCRVEVNGNDNLKEGENIVTVTFIDPKGNKTDYLIYVIVGDIEDSSDLGLKSLNISNHVLDKEFGTNRLIYIVHGISEKESNIDIDFSLLYSTNTYELRLNGTEVSRPVTKNGDINSIYFNVQTELLNGANKLEIIVKDDKGNTKTYIVYLVVEKETVDVIQIAVDYFDSKGGRLVVTGITPGWRSETRQHVRITNGSNYDVKVKFDWTEVSNDFNNKDDLVYTFYKNNTVLKTESLPSKDALIMSGVSINANTVNDFYFDYEYKYRSDDQNIDQGKTYTGVIRVSLEK